MTHTTDAERAHALAEKHGATSYRNRADTSNPAFGFTLGQLEALISEVEQAARRAPTVPIPRGWNLVPQRLTQDMADAAKCVDGRLSVWKYDDAYKAMLAAAPQPPEATPVQLPEPDSYIFQHEETGLTQFVDAQQVQWGFEKNNPRWKRVGSTYTEQQVRELLAAHGIQEQST